MVNRANRLAQFVLQQRTWVIAVIQGLLIFLSLLLAWLLRFDFQLPNARILLAVAPLVILIRLATIRMFNLMHGWWRYVGIDDAWALLKATLLGSVISLVLIRFVLGVTEFPPSIYVLEALLSCSLLAGARVSSRILAECVVENKDSRRLLLVGAGHAASTIIRETKQVATGYVVTACVDDDRSKSRIKIHGVPVIGTVDMLPGLIKEHEVDEYPYFRAFRHGFADAPVREYV